MHLYVIARGMRHNVAKWCNDVEAIYVPYTTWDGKEIMTHVQVREIKLLEIAFPEKQMKEVLPRIHPYNDYRINDSLIRLMRKLLRLEPIPVIVNPNKMIPRRWVHIIPIGMRRDQKHEYGDDYL